MDAWIETLIRDFNVTKSTVASHVDAWIETPLRRLAVISVCVAPHVGAWIEVIKDLKGQIRYQSASN